MASCKDCIGYKFCSRGKNGLTNFYGAEVACNNVEYLCNDFANKSNFQLVKHGEWIKAGFGITERIVCSQCKSNKGSYMKPMFCNQCGAIMDGGKNE